MIVTCKQRTSNPYFKLSVCGMFLMVTPIVLSLFIDHIFTLNRFAEFNLGLAEPGRSLRAFHISMSQSDLIMNGIGFVVPAIGTAMVLVAWWSMIRQQVKSNRTLTPETKPVQT